MKYGDFLDFSKNRRSVREYLPDEVPDEDIKKILTAGIQAPSGTNSQGWKFRVLKSRDDIVRLSEIVKKKIEYLVSLHNDSIIKRGMVEYGGNFFFFKDAPVVIIIYAKKPNNLAPYFFGDGLHLYKGIGSLISVGMVMQNMMLSAASLGLGTCPLTGPLLAENEIDSEFIPPNKFELAAILTLGVAKRTPASPGRKDIDKFIVT